MNTFTISIRELESIHLFFIPLSWKREDQKKSRRGKYYAYLYHKLYDGCHASYSLSDEWSVSLTKAIEKNNELEDSDQEDGPKRANGWRD